MTTHKHTSWRRLLTLAAISLCLGTGCPGESVSPYSNASDAQCSVDAECADGLVCHAQGVCAVAEQDAITKRVSFIFSPPTETGLLAQRSNTLDVSSIQSLDFVLEPSVPVTGEVKDAEGKRILGGTLIFTPSNDLNGVLRRQTTITEELDYDIDLVPGVYDVTFLSGIDELPNRRWNAQTIGAATVLDFILPPSSSITTVEGTLTHRDPTLNVDPALNRIAVSGARIVAVAGDGTTSTTSVSDEQGNFSIKVWADNGAHDLSIGPAQPNGLVPQFVEANAFDVSGGQAQAVALDLGSWSTMPVELRVALLEEGLMSSDSTLDFEIGDARLLLTGHFPNGQQITLYYTLGSKEPLALLKIPYTISFIPPPQSRHGILTFEWDPNGPDSLFTSDGFVLPQRRELAALITDAFGNPVPNARVELSAKLLPTQDKSDAPASRQAVETEAREFTVQTNSSGEFTAWLEPDWTYEVRVVPQLQSSAPSGTFTIAPLLEKSEADYILSLPKPMVIFGSVNRIDGDVLNPVENLSFNIYDYSDPDVPRPIGQGRTDDTGAFRVLVPAKENM